MYVIGDWDNNRTPNKVYRILAVSPSIVRIPDEYGFTTAEWDWWVKNRNVRICPILKKERNKCSN